MENLLANLLFIEKKYCTSNNKEFNVTNILGAHCMYILINLININMVKWYLSSQLYNVHINKIFIKNMLIKCKIIPRGFIGEYLEKKEEINNLLVKNCILYSLLVINVDPAHLFKTSSHSLLFYLLNCSLSLSLSSSH